MPFVNVKVIEGVFSPTQKQDMVRRLTDTMVEIAEGETRLVRTTHSARTSVCAATPVRWRHSVIVAATSAAAQRRQEMRGAAFR